MKKMISIVKKAKQYDSKESLNGKMSYMKGNVGKINKNATRR
jgi:hypothetical protein